MKFLCNCTSKWEFDLSSAENSVFQLMLGDFREFHNGPYFSIVCERCKLDMWVNPQYENMMFDLKGMNE